MTARTFSGTRSSFDQTYVIAEMACSHEGDPGLARKIIDGAGKAGADAVQFQIWDHREIVVPHHPDSPMMRKLQLSDDDWLGLRDYVRERYPGMHIVACVYEPKSVRFADGFGADAFKLHSADLSNPFMLKCLAETGKRIDLSIGGSTLEEIEKAIETIRIGSDPTIWLMYGMQLFPTVPEVLNLRYMTKLKDLFELPVGYQDHTAGDAPGAFHVPAAAMGMGVEIVEKHITHDRSFKGVDHEAALNPSEFVSFVKMVRDIDAAMGLSVPHPFTEAEERYRNYSKKSIVCARDIHVGTILSSDDLRFMRSPELGLQPDQLEAVVGRTVLRSLVAHEIVSPKDIR